MPSPILSRAPQCMNCVRRITGSLFDAGASRQQIRGKKKLVKVTTVKVHLLVNVPGYGRRGAVIPITPGMMRNIWFPRHMAEYVTDANAQQLGVKSGAQFEREYSFKSAGEKKRERQILLEERLEQETAEKEVAEQEALSKAWLSSYGDSTPKIAAEVRAEMAAKAAKAEPAIEIDLMTPEQTLSILETLVPANIDIYRTRITQNKPKASPSIASSATTSLAPQGPPSKAIYGSVSTSDIAEDIKTILQDSEQGSRVVLTAADISFVTEAEESDRVKHLGVFEIEIKVEGAGDVVRRTISIKDQN